MQYPLEEFTSCRVAVIGDIMLDCYMSGEVSRISPEAPVPVMRVTDERAVPGGAANVAANLMSLGVFVNIVGLAGQDSAHDELINRLRALGRIDCSGVIAQADRRTTRKLRIIGAHQQIVRVDHEDVFPPDAATRDTLARAAAKAIESADAVIVSDYGKGTCTDEVLRVVFDGAQVAGRPVVVDPKRRDFAAYRGATVVTPNRAELAEATGLPCGTDGEAAAAAAAAQAACGADILLTRSEKGMSYFPVGAEPFHLMTVAQDVFDVSGAGDTVVAVVAAALAAEMPFVDAMRLANHAAGIVVSKLGTASVTRDELAAAMRTDEGVSTESEGRLLTREEAIAQRMAWARENLTVGITNGCFDLLHPGHVTLIRKAAESCDRLIVALNTDASVARLKGVSRPIQDEASRAAIMGMIKGVAAVVLFDEETPHELIAAMQPDVLVKGADYRLDQVVGADIVQARGGRIVLVDLAAGQSTTRLIARSAA